jgi:hypothetical protein
VPLSIKQLLEPKLTPCQQKLKDFLDSDKSGSAYGIQEITEKMGMTVRNVVREAGPVFLPYIFKHRKCVYFASPAVVKEFQRAVKA